MLFNENNNNNLNRILCNTIMINYKMPRNISIKCFFNIVILLTIFVSVVHACGPGRGIGGPRKNRKLTPLVFKQHVPNMSENTLGASGLQEGKIKRDHPKFRDLVPNYNKDIIFKDEEGTGADRLMTQRCKERLNTLAVSVMNQWPGVRLRVTESWDEDNLHGPDSLHYEGRAVDITTSDRDRSKYGMLARLAVEAGFDWVYYESRAHIHCSVKSDSKQLHHTSGCFTANSTVYTSTGEKRRLSDLKIGEKVLSISSDGKAVFSDVISFLDRHSELNRKFVRIKTDGGATITSTPEHLIMIWKPNEKYQFIFADQIEEGDYLLVNKNNTFIPRKVIRITVINSKGVYAPLTREGTIIIDSIAASCYALVNSQSLAHWSFMPLRIMNSIWDWFHKTSIHTTEQIGIHWYAQLLYSFRNYLVPNDLIYQ